MFIQLENIVLDSMQSGRKYDLLLLKRKSYRELIKQLHHHCFICLAEPYQSSDITLGVGSITVQITRHQYGDYLVDKEALVKFDYDFYQLLISQNRNELRQITKQLLDEKIFLPIEWQEIESK